MNETDFIFPAINFDTTTFLDDMVRTGVAIILGGIVGAERQLAGQSNSINDDK